MNAIKSVRRKLSLSQDQMALCLGISRTMVSHCETGRKQLSTPALQRLAQMEMLQNNMQEKMEARKAAEDKLVNEHYERSRNNPDPKLRMHALRTIKLQRYLLSMRKKSEAVTNQLEITNNLAKKARMERTKENVFLDMLEADLTEKFLKVAPTKQLLLKARIFGRMREYEVLNGEI